MYDTIPDHLRKLSIDEIFAIPTFRNCWAIWQPEIIRLLGNNYNENQVSQVIKAWLTNNLNEYSKKEKN